MNSSAPDLQIPSAPLQAQQMPNKFKKNSSFSSIKTTIDFYIEEETVCRKVSLCQKQMFIELITLENFNMKEAAKCVNISYSTAKKVFSRFRRTLKSKSSLPVAQKSTGVVCSFREVSSGPQLSETATTIELISTIAGREQLEFSYKSPTSKH